MKKTVGKSDRALRILVAAGAVVGSGVLGFSTGWGIVLLVAAAVMVVTSASGYCPLYSLLGIHTTCAVDADHTSSGLSQVHRAA